MTSFAGYTTDWTFHNVREDIAAARELFENPPTPVSFAGAGLPSVGSVVAMGAYQGARLTWTVVARKGYTALLLCNSTITAVPSYEFFGNAFTPAEQRSIERGVGMAHVLTAAFGSEDEPLLEVNPPAAFIAQSPASSPCVRPVMTVVF